MKIFTRILVVAGLLVMTALNLGILTEKANALSDETKVYAGFKTYGADGRVIGCDCPVMEGNCSCTIRPMPH